MTGCHQDHGRFLKQVFVHNGNKKLIRRVSCLPLLQIEIAVEKTGFVLPSGKNKDEDQRAGIKPVIFSMIK